jgi:hypothetical protein
MENPVSFTVTDAMVLAFSSNVRFLAQQKYSRFRPCLMEDNITGEAAYMEQVAPTGARKVIARHSDSPMMNTQHLRRRIAPYDYDWGDLVDRLDRARLLIDPASTYAQNAAFAMQRGFDDEAIAAGFGVAYAGHAGATALTWPNGNTESTPAQPAGTVVAVNDWTYGNGSGNSGLTVSKLISALVALQTGEGEEDEEIYLGCGAKQFGNLLATTEFTNADYNAVRELTRGKIQGGSFINFNFIHTERQQLNGSGQTRVMAWRKSGLGMGVARGIESRISERADKRFGLYVYSDMAIGAARLEEVKVVEIVCV